MAEERRFFTSESVAEGHPDKMCDQISDAILDEILAKDPTARVACETLAATGVIMIVGEISTSCYVDIPSVVRRTVQNIGYTRAKYGFDASTCAVLTSIDEQSSDIAMGVDDSSEYKTDGSDPLDKIGAGDQGMMFGFACDETPELMPLPIMLAHRLSARLAEVRKSGLVDYLRPDGKSQVTVEYVNDRPVRMDAVVLSAQHAPEVSHEQLEKDLTELVIRAVIPQTLLDEKTKIYVNPTGKFVIGGPQGDSGLTGRKIIVDTYGGYCPHGGGAFSGKDPTKVDRSAAYMARYVCKNLVAAGVCRKVELQLSYAIGVAKPVSIAVNTFGTSQYSNERIAALVEKVFDLRPQAIIDCLQLQRPIYSQTAAYGHFGKAGLPWEETNRVEEIRKQLAKG